MLVAARIVGPFAAVALAFVLRMTLVPLTGKGAPFVLFFGAVLLTSLYLGARSGLVAAVLSAPVGAYVFVFRAGYSSSQAICQGTLFFLESMAVIYLARAVTRARRSAEAAAIRERRAARLRDDLVAMVSHDLRTPLSAIRIGAAAITKSAASGDLSGVERAVGAVGRSSARMSNLIEDLLDVARAEAGALRVSTCVQSAVPLLRDAVDQLRPLAEQRRVEIEWDEGAVGALPIRCEGARIVQVLTNLLGNAVKFTPPGGRVAVKATARERFVEVEIADTGPGIAPKQIPRVFDRYWQGEDGRRHPGVGLGLAIARALVRAHGGEIWAASEPGHGASFFFTVPRALEAPLEACLEASAGAVRAPAWRGA